ncbi:MULTISPECIES: YczE/YyaS/YitT family protein [Psychrilyobacter]|uniref:Membrane protein n=1 Tax=Psychrilyobacter piezotolerans TaxID=2293438 RepID=A0ABX9KJ29_9FUSO|nr:MULTISPECIES: DUF6198 family protein [Psychrilyobacter]MCS5420614.1 DUF6198 family protein [Psychrilyobacter sp. S5]NDI77367.1 membrane protein [Psychrilyobacter piezotolerans]RDE63672.1 membrane protein [Psychrilyobacter sp. S5]REI42016.1 membrane protein [Psychrilyobacter piezotolerans]
MFLKVTYYLIGLFLLALGITFTLISDLGAGGWDALVENLYKLTGIKVGNWLIIIAFILLIVAAILKKEFLNYKAFIVSIILGKLIDFCYYPLIQVLKSESFIIKIFILFTGLILVGIGCAMMFVTKLPKNHTETFVFSIADTTEISYRKIKTTADVSALIIALVIGFKLKDFSNLGVGTVLSSFFMGSIIHYMMPLARNGLHYPKKIIFTPLQK